MDAGDDVAGIPMCIIIGAVPRQHRHTSSIHLLDQCALGRIRDKSTRAQVALFTAIERRHIDDSEDKRASPKRILKLIGTVVA